MPIKIVHIIPELGIGGAEGMLLRLIGSATSQTEDHVLISLRRDEKHAERFLKLGIKVHFLHMAFFPSPLTVWKCAKIIRQENPALVFTWLYLGDLLGTLSRFLIKQAPALVWNIRCSNAQEKDWRPTRWMVCRLLALLSPFADKIICNSQRGIEYHKKIGYKNRNWYLVPNGFDTEQFKPSKDSRDKLRQELAIPTDAQVIGIVARFDKLKDYPTFLAAAKNLQLKYPETHFVLVGEGIVRENRELIPHLKGFAFPERIHLLGKRSDVPRLLNVLDIFTLTSLSEGFPNVIAEAMATEVMCVATDVGASKEILGGTGFLIEPQNIQALTEAWEKALNMPVEEKLKQKCDSRKRILELFSLANITQSYRDIYIGMVKTTSLELQTSN